VSIGRTDGEGDGSAASAGASAAFLTSASQQTASEAYRVEQSLTMQAEGDGESIDIDGVLMTGVQDGEAYAYEIDMGEIFAQMESSVGGGVGDAGVDVEDMSAEVAGDADEVYVRGPMFGVFDEMGAAGGPQAEALGDLPDLTEQWGRVDLTQLDEEAGAWGGGLSGVLGSGSSSADPQQVLEMLGAGGEVEDLGTDEIDGAQVTGMGTSLTLRDLMEAQGMDQEEWIDQQLGGGGDMGLGESLGASGMIDGMLDTQIPFEVWADGDGHVRRISYEIDMAAMMADVFAGLSELEGGSDDGAPEAFPGTFVMGGRIDLSDHGDPGISVELPDPSEAVDITDAYAEALGGN
jgi:hypothetical protein